MKEIIKKIKRFFGFFEAGESYYIKIDDIVIPEEFKATYPRFKKMVEKREYFRKYGKYESKVILNKDFMLIDGYTTYLLCIENGEKYVDVYFVD